MCPSSAKAMGTAVGMMIAIVPQLVPVANEVREATRKTIAGKISGETLPVSKFMRKRSVLRLSRRLKNIRRGRLRGIGRILREFSDLVGEFCHQFRQFSNLFFKNSNTLIALFELLFKFGNTLNIELFFLRSQLLSSCLSTGLLSDKLRALLEKNIDLPP